MEDKEIIKLISKAIVAGKPSEHNDWEIPVKLSEKIVKIFDGDVNKFFDILTKYQDYLSVIGVKLEFYSETNDLHSIYYNGYEINYWDFGWG